MFGIFIFTIIELMLFSLFYKITLVGESLFVIINSFYVVFYVIKKYPKYSYLIIFGYILRMLILFIDYNHIFSVLHSGADTEIFHRNASFNALRGSYDLVRTNYHLFLTWLYMLLGDCRFIAQYINVIFGLGVLIYIFKIIDEYDMNERVKKQTLTIAVIFPHLIIFSGILLREAWCEFFVSASLFYFVRWMKRGGVYSASISIICVLFAAWMHSGCVFVAVGYLIAIAFYHPKKMISKVSVSAIVISVVLILISIVVLTSTDIFTGKLNTFDEEKFQENGMYSEIRGGSAYLTWINPNSAWQLILFSPLKIFYFLFSPIPIDWRGSQDIIAFFLDSVFYIYIIYNVFKYYKKIQFGMSKNMLRYLMISLFILSFIFAYGTVNSGTAIRHRCKIFPIILTMYAVSVSEKRKKMYINN